MGKKRVGKLLESDEAVDLVYSYYKGALRKDGSRFPYSGAQFEFLGGGGHRPEVANRITAEDIVAVSMLGARVPAFAALALLDSEADRITTLLERLPRLQKLGATDLDDLLDPEQPAVQLWSLLSSIPGLGPTKVSKLMARKRPHLVPVYDRVIGGALGLIDGHWDRVHDLVRTREHRLAAIRTAAKLGTRVPLIRIVDVAVWMKHEGVQQLPRGGALAGPQ